MTLRDLYYNTTNPLDNDEFIEEMINVYQNSKINNTENQIYEDMYSSVIRFYEKRNPKGFFAIDEREKKDFTEFLFKLYKERINNIDLKADEKKYPKSKEEISELNEYLKSDIGRSYDSLSKEMERNERLKYLATKYVNVKNLSPKDFKLSNSWHQVNSGDFYSRGLKADEIKHRLYLNTIDSITIPMLEEFILKAKEKKVKFIFKYPKKPTEARDDTIVFYASDENLMDYINILREIKSEHPEYNKGILNPPVLTAAIDGWIGYGSNRDNDKSFNGLRTELILNSLEEVEDEWYKDRKKYTYNYKNRKLSYEDFIVELMTNKALEDLEEISHKELMNNEKIRNKIKDYYKTNLEVIDNERIIPEKYNLEFIINKKKEVLSTDEVRDTALEYCFSYIPDLKNKVKKRIGENSIEEGIDPNHISFNSDLSKEFKFDIKKPRNRGLKETDEEYNSYLSNFYQENFPQKSSKNK